MTRVLGTAAKVDLRNLLFNLGVQALREQGWTVERAAGLGKSSVRRISKAGEKPLLVSIRTTQDTAIAFPREKDDKSWVTLSDVDYVLAVSVDDAYNPRFAQAHMIPGKEMRDRFDRAYAARRKAGHSIPLGRGVWVSLYTPDSNETPTHVGGGAGLAHAPIKRVPLDSPGLDRTPHWQPANGGSPGLPNSPVIETGGQESGISISEAKRLLGIHLGIDPSQIKITVEA